MLNAVIATLTMGADEVNVATDHGNSKLEREFKDGVQAYAKIAGATWTYYVKTLRVNIGRPPDSSPATNANADPSAAPPPQSSPGVEGADNLVVHIDLGPSKLISRQHAIIEYATEGVEGWQLIVYGRNGVKVNDQIIRRGGRAVLQSGDILEIGGTQMMFVTPNDAPRVHPSFLATSGLNASTGRVGNSRPNVSASKPAGATRIARSASVPQRPSTAGSKTPSGTRALPSPIPTEAHGQSTPGGPATRTPQMDSKDKPSPSYNRGLMLETTQEIDYSLESAKDIKPPYSYAIMIGQAILASEEEKLTLNAIYQSIMDRYAFYRLSQTGWQV